MKRKLMMPCVIITFSVAFRYIHEMHKILPSIFYNIYPRVKLRLKGRKGKAHMEKNSEKRQNAQTQNSDNDSPR